MKRLQVGDRVKITPTITICPWKGNLTGVVILMPGDGTAGIEVDSKEKLGHSCSIGVYEGKTDNGWWFTLEELELVKAE